MKRPKNFFRFFNIEGGFWTLRTGLLRFNYACNFNDEYELNPDTFVNDTVKSISFEDFKKQCEQVSLFQPLRSTEANMFSLYNKYQLNEEQYIERGKLIFRHFRENDLILCLTREIQSLNMWNNYAQCSEGIAIEFEASEERDNIFCLAEPIQYIDSHPRRHESFSERINRTLFNILRRQKPENILKEERNKFCYTKMNKWKNEKEWRVIVPTSRFLKYPTLENLKLSRQKQIEQKIIEPWDKIANQQIALDNRDVKAIYLGHNCKIRDMILFLKKRIYAKTLLYQGRLSEDSVQFQLIP